MPQCLLWLLIPINTVSSACHAQSLGLFILKLINVPLTSAPSLAPSARNPRRFSNSAPRTHPSWCTTGSLPSPTTLWPVSYVSPECRDCPGSSSAYHLTIYFHKDVPASQLSSRPDQVASKLSVFLLSKPAITSPAIKLYSRCCEGRLF